MYQNCLNFKMLVMCCTEHKGVRRSLV